MKQSDELFGLDDQEKLDNSVEDVVTRILDESVQDPGETFDATASRIEWPLRVRVYRRMDVSRMSMSIADDALERALETLDEEHSDPDGNPTEPTPEMKAAAETFAKAITGLYVSWACEPTDRQIEVGIETARRIHSETTL